MGLCRFLLTTLCFFCMVLGVFLLCVPSLRADSETNQEERLCARVAIINHTPSFELEIAIDGQGPTVIGKGKTTTLFLKNKEVFGRHEVTAKAFTPAKHFDRCQIGKELAVTFEVTGKLADSPAGKVGWHKVFTHRDFCPTRRSFRRTDMGEPGQRA
jgi:hypothetical protein